MQKKQNCIGFVDILGQLKVLPKGGSMLSKGEQSVGYVFLSTVQLEEITFWTLAYGLLFSFQCFAYLHRYSNERTSVHWPLPICYHNNHKDWRQLSVYYVPGTVLSSFIVHPHTTFVGIGGNLAFSGFLFSGGRISIRVKLLAACSLPHSLWEGSLISLAGWKKETGHAWLSQAEDHSDLSVQRKRKNAFGSAC